MSVSWLQTHLYPDRLSRDPVMQFVRVLEEYVRTGDDVLDMGAGAGELNAYALKGRVGRLVGVDLDARVKDNPLLDEGHVADVSHLPFVDGHFDLAFSIYVLEHLPDPEAFICEVWRVLKPGGLFLALTPNLHHYVSLISALTPTSFHRWFNKRRGREEKDTFPTCYRMNTRRALARQFRGGGFEVVRLTTIEVQPNYLTFCAPAFLMGAMYERLVNRLGLLSEFRVNIIGVFRKAAVIGAGMGESE